MKKRLIINKPNPGRFGQYTFFDDSDTNYDESNGLSSINDKFSDTDLYSVVKDSKLNDYIVRYGIPYSGLSFVKIDEFVVDNSGVAGDIESADIKLYMFDNFAWAEYNNVSNPPEHNSWQSSLVNGSGFTDCQVLDFYKSSYSEGTGPGTLLEKLDFLKYLNKDPDKISVKQSHKAHDFKPEQAFLPTSPNSNISIFSSDGTQTIYLVVQMDGERDRPWWQGGTDYRKTKHQVFSFNATELFESNGDGKLTTLNFEYADSVNTDGDGGGAWSEAPAFLCSRLSLTISTIPGEVADDAYIPIFALSASKDRIQPPEPLNPNNFDLSFIYQNPYREITNLTPSKVNEVYASLTYDEFGNPLDDVTIEDKLSFIKKDFEPVPKVNILGNSSYELQAYQTSSFDRQICSAPNQVSLDFYLSPTGMYTSWEGASYNPLVYNEWGVLSTINFEEPTLDLSLFRQDDKGRPAGYLEFHVHLTDTTYHIDIIEITTGQNNAGGFKYRPDVDGLINDGEGWKVGWNKCKIYLPDVSYWWHDDGTQVNFGAGETYDGSINFNRLQIYSDEVKNIPDGSTVDETIYLANFIIYESELFDYELQDDTQFYFGSGITGGNSYVGAKFFVIDWDDTENEHDTIEDFFKGFPKTLSSLRLKRNDNLYKISDVGTPLAHTYFTPGLKTIKSVLFTHTVEMKDKPMSRVQPMRWKFITTRIFLDIPLNKYPDFDDFGGADYTTIPWPYTTPVIGGIDENSKYKKSVSDTLSGGKIGNADIIDETFLSDAKYNDEIGKSIRMLDLEQVRVFNNGSYDMNKLLGIEQRYDVNTNDDYLATLPFPQYKEEFDISDFMDDTWFYDDLNVFDKVTWFFPPAFRPDIANYLTSTNIDNIPSAGNNSYNNPSYFFNPSITNVYTPFDDFDYWDCSDWNLGRNHCFSDETSVGEIFISDNNSLSIKNNCKLEFNFGTTIGGSVDDSYGKGNKGILIGDYKIKKYNKNEQMKRDSYIKKPTKSSEDKAL